MGVVAVVFVSDPIVCDGVVVLGDPIINYYVVFVGDYSKCEIVSDFLSSVTQYVDTVIGRRRCHHCH